MESNSNRRLRIAFTTNKHGKRIAYRYDAYRCWWRIALAEAELLIASGQAEEIRYCR